MLELPQGTALMDNLKQCETVVDKILKTPQHCKLYEMCIIGDMVMLYICTALRYLYFYQDSMSHIQDSGK